MARGRQATRSHDADTVMTAPRATIVHVITQLELGGAQQNTLDTCALLDRSRFDVVLLAGPGGRLDSQAGNIEDLDFKTVKQLVRRIAPLADRAAFVEIRDILRRLADSSQAPLIVHTHSTKAGIVGRLAARSAGASGVVHTIHGFGHPALGNPLLRRAGILAEQYLAPRTDRFIAVSFANVAEGHRLGLFRTTPVTVIRSGFDLESFRAPTITRDAARAAIDQSGDAPIVGMVACLKPQKAPLDFAEIAARVLRRVPRAHFVLAGDGELRTDLEARVRALGIESQFHLLGWRDDVPRVLRALDVFVLTSRWEGLPRSVVQAMASGVPVVANAVDGVADVVIDDRTGFSISPGDIGAAAARIVALLEDRSLATRLANEASKNLSEFDVREMVAAQERLYSELVKIRDHDSLR